jgi:hypothetical protein
LPASGWVSNDETPNPSNWGDYSEDQDEYMKRQRGRGRKPGGGGGGGNHGNHGNRPFESNGPEVKIRGTAAQIYEKYAQYARDAQSGGDRVRYESYLQHAEHYYRVMAATMPRERLLQQQEAGFGQAQGEGQGNNFGQQPQGGNPQGQTEGGEQADPMKVVDAEGGADDDEGDFDGEGAEGGEDSEGGGEEFRADSNVQQHNQGGNDNRGNDNRGDGRGPRRRRGRRGRPQDGPGGGGGEGPGGGNGNGGGNGGGGGGGSALDSLARRQGALAGS